MTQMRRVFLLAALCALSALSLPALAQAEGLAWTIGGTQIDEDKAVDVNGQIGFRMSAWEFNCDFTGEATIVNGESGPTGKIEHLTVPGSGTCIGYYTWKKCETQNAGTLGEQGDFAAYKEASATFLESNNKYTMKFPSECGSGIGLTFTTDGWLAGEFKDGCNDLSLSSLHVKGLGTTQQVWGGLCFSSPEGAVALEEGAPLPPERKSWYFEGEKVGDKAHALTVPLDAEIHSLILAGAGEVGCPEGEATAVVWNSPSGGTGEITNLSFLEGLCEEVFILGVQCTETSVTATGLPWPISLEGIAGEGGGSGVTISGVGLTNAFSEDCPLLKNKTISVSGNLDKSSFGEEGFELEGTLLVPGDSWAQKVFASELRNKSLTLK